MARTTTTGQLANLTTAWRREAVEVWVANSLDVLVEFTADVLAWSIRGHVDQAGLTASVVLNREDSGGSLAPAMNATPPIEVGRRIEIRADVSAHGGTPSVQTIFQGTVQRPEWGGRGSELTLTCRDKWATLEDTWIESESTYGSAPGTAIETVMQSILTDAGTGETLTVSGAPTSVVYTYTQQRMSVASALRELLRINGWDLRYLWNGSSFALTLYQPNRSKTVPDWTFTADDYRTISSVSKDSSGVRNVVGCQYSTGGGTVTTTDATSTGEHGRRFMFIDASQDPQITTSGQALTVTQAAAGDLAQPLVQQVADMRFWWPLELGDLCRFPADSVFRNAVADLSVVGFEHAGRAGQPAASTVQLRGTPSAGTLRWSSIANRTQRAQQLTGGGVGQLPPGSDTIVPVVSHAVQQVGTSGLVTLTLQDPSTLIDAVAFQPFTGGGDFDFTTSPTGWAIYDNSAPYTLTDSVQLGEDHAAFIAYAYRQDIGSGAEWVRRLVTFDRNVVPSFAAGLSAIGGSVLLAWSGSEDLASIRWALSTTGMPTTGAVAAGTVASGRQSDGVTLTTGLAEGGTAYVRARGYSTATGGGTASVTDFTESVTRPAADGNRIPSLRWSTYVTGNTFGFSGVLVDPEGLVDATSYETAAGGQSYNFTGSPTGWSGYDAVAPYNTTATAAVVEGHNSRIIFGIRFDLGEGAGAEWKTVETVGDLNVIPGLSCSLTRSGTGTDITMSHIGDDDLASIRYLTSTTGMPPTGGIGAGTIVNGQSAATVIATGISATDNLYVRARGYSSTGGVGAESSADWTGRIGEAVPDGSVTAPKLADGAVIATKIRKGAQHFGSSVRFSSDLYNRLLWSTGVIAYADGDNVSITTSGSQAAMFAGTIYYVYHDGTSATLTVTTNYATLASGEDYTLLCVARRAAATDEGECYYVDALGQVRVGTNEISNNAIEANSIRTDAVTATKIQANAVTAAKINVISLSAISVDAGTITAGILQNAASTTFVDLDATGTATFIKCGSDVVMKANGTAVFGGEVSSSTFSASVAAFNSASFDSIDIKSGASTVGTVDVAGTGASLGLLLNPVTGQDVWVGGDAIGQSLRVYGTSEFRDDITVTGGGLTVASGVTVQGALTVSGNFDANGDVALGGATTDSVGFFGSAGSAKGTITGSRGGNVALADLLNTLAGYGLIVNSTSA